MKRILCRLDSPLAPLLITAIVVFFFVLGMLSHSGFNASSFVVAGDTFCDPAAAPHNLAITKNQVGYDGQFYYRFALDPFTSKRTDFGITLDNPPYRHQRILYPFMAWVMSAGSAGLTPWMMLFINYFALCLLGWLGGVYAQTFKQHALWGIFLPLYPASLMSLTRDLVEVLEVSLLVGSLLLLRRGKPVWGAVLLTLAVLAKETALLVAGAAALDYIFRWRGEPHARKRWYYFTLPVVIFLVLQIALRINWGEFPILAGKMNLGIPPAGFIGLLIKTSALQTRFDWKTFSQLILLTFFTLGVIYHLRYTAAAAPKILSWFFYLVFALSLSQIVWVEDWAYLRALSEFCVLGILIIIGANSGARAKVMVLGSFSIIWLYNLLRLQRKW